VGRGTKPTILFFWFPRAGVVTHSGRASVQYFGITRRWRVANAFPRQRVGTRKRETDCLSENKGFFIV